jgi:hypothetical protein
MPLMCLHVLTQERVDPGLVARALILEPRQDIGIQTNGHCLLGRDPHLGPAEEIIVQERDIRGIDLMVALVGKTVPVTAPTGIALNSGLRCTCGSWLASEEASKGSNQRQLLPQGIRLRLTLGPG